MNVAGILKKGACLILLEFLAKYWLEFVCGILALGITGFAKWVYNLKKSADKSTKQKENDQTKSSILKEIRTLIEEERKHTKMLLVEERTNNQKLLDEERKKSIEGDKDLKTKVESLDSKVSNLDQKVNNLTQNIRAMETNVSDLRHGILSIQGKQFKQDCRNLLAPGHEITLEEFEEIEEEHDIYNQLDGNHNGDKLFQMVEEKYRSHLSDDK